MGTQRSSEELPYRGQLLRDYELRRVDGSTFQLSQYRNRANLLVFAIPHFDSVHGAMLSALESRQPELNEHETRVIVIGGDLPNELSTSFDWALDNDGGVVESLTRGASVGIYLTDKFLEVIHRWLVAPTDNLPSADDLLGWARFAAMQCPECHPPEWPADEIA